LIGKLHGNLFAGFGPTPDRHVLIALQDHVVGEQARQFQRGIRAQGKWREKEGGGQCENVSHDLDSGRTCGNFKQEDVQR
jgi:hypothetical protein